MFVFHFQTSKFQNLNRQFLQIQASPTETDVGCFYLEHFLDKYSPLKESKSEEPLVKWQC